jgi:excisionase family DNA binding protein
MQDAGWAAIERPLRLAILEHAGMLTTKQAAAALGIADVHYIRKLIKDGKLKAQKIGRDWFIAMRDLERYKSEHPRSKAGRPKSK